MRRIKKILKGIFLVGLVAFIGIQFIPIEYNLSDVVSENDISKTFEVPNDVQNMLRASCYDCHSNNTQYPWYNKIQPVSWIMERHIINGKKDLNFSEFGAYSNRKKKSKLKSILNQIKEDNMPLSSYLIIHRKSILSEKDKLKIISWIEQQRDRL